MVWSDPDVRKLAREFVTVTEEVHFLYPEGEWAQAQVKDDPAHRFFKKFGEAMPSEDWNHPGTKQGVYMIGPNAEYLQGGGAISGDAERVAKRLRDALERWASLRKKRKYRNRPVPRVENVAPPDVEGKPLVFRVFLRDLPRGGRDRSGRRFTKADLRGMWLDFTKWAWNVNWIAFDDPTAFVPRGKAKVPVDPNVLRRLCRHVLVDNVRGQTPRWRPAHVKEATLTMRRVKASGDRVTIAYEGQARMESESQSYAPSLRGRGIWNVRKTHFESFDLVAVGRRAGQGRFNQRGRDRGPAPMGVALVLHR